MSAIFYTHRNGKKETAFKYEIVERVWYTKDKNGKDQISIYIGNKIHSTWKLDPKDIELTQKSHEQACKTYNESLIKIGKITGLKRKIREKDLIKKKKKKRRKTYTV